MYRISKQSQPVHSNRRGAIAVLVAISLIAIFGVLALVVDGGLMYDYKRKVQCAADAAALAAAVDLFSNYAVNQGVDPHGTAQASALSTALANGYDNNGNTSIVTVNIPPASGITAGMAGYAEVIVQYNQARGFSSLFGPGKIPVTARAVARGIPGNIGILILDLHLADACEIDGNVNILNGGQIYSNSDSTSANDTPKTGSVFVDSTSTLTTGGINVRGTLVNAGSITYTNNGGAKTYSKPIADPLSAIPEPTTAGLQSYGNVTITANTTLSPGIYGNITIGSGSASGGAGPSVIMLPGIYYLDKGGSLVLNSGSLTGSGVMFFNNTGGDKVLHPASGPVNLTPPTPTSGGAWPGGTTSATYSGISFWIPRSQTAEVHIESTYNLTMPGTWYAQAGEYDIRPDGASTVFNIGNYICDQAEWGQGYSTGKSDGIINMNPTTATPTMRPTLVE